MKLNIIKHKYSILESIVIAFLVGIFAKLQFSFTTIYGADGHLHIRMAEFLRTMGPWYDFHWTQFSIFIDKFSDKDFLYHLLLIPFTFFGDIFQGAKLSTVFFYLMLLLTMYWMLKKYSRRSIVWFFLLLSASPMLYILELFRPRPFALLFSLTFIGLHFIINRNRMGVFVTGILYAYTHVSAPYLILYAFVSELLHLCTDREHDFSFVLYAAGGVLSGYVINPYFPHNFYQTFLNSIMVPYYASKAGILEMGAEFFPWNSRDLLLFYPAMHAGIWSSLLIMLCSKQEYSFKTRYAGVMMFMFYSFSFLSKRYAVHCWPLFIFYMAMFYSETDFSKLFKRAGVLYLVFLCTVGCFGLFSDIKNYSPRIRSNEIINKHYRGVAEVFKKIAPEGERIFLTNWSDSQYLIGLDPDHDYYVTLDPVYMYHYDKDKYRLYRDIAFGRCDDPYKALTEEFATRYIYAGKNYFSGLIDQIAPDPRFRLIAQDSLGAIFALDVSDN